MAECHPVGFQWVMEAKARGATVIHVDPRFTRTSAVADLHVPIPYEGSYPADLRAFLTASFGLGRRRPVADVLRALMARAQIEEAFGQRFRGSFLERRRDALAVILDRAQARGDLPPQPPPGTVADIVFGVIWYRLLATGQALDDRLAKAGVVPVLVEQDAVELQARARLGVAVVHRQEFSFTDPVLSGAVFNYCVHLLIPMRRFAAKRLL